MELKFPLPIYLPGLPVWSGIVTKSRATSEYFPSRNPVRVKELEEIRKSKMKKVVYLVEEKNRYLAEHPRTVESVAVRIVDELSLEQFLKVKDDDQPEM